MRIFLSITILFVVVFKLSGQNTNSQIYDPDADPKKQIQLAVDQAGEENKHVLIQVGGNWCSWCIKLHKFIEDHPQLDSLIKADYILIRVNYSKENKNMDIMTELDFPQRFGFPVLVILDGEGNRIHTQNTLYLEKDKSYSEERIKDLLLSWTALAVNPKRYTSD